MEYLTTILQAACGPVGHVILQEETTEGTDPVSELLKGNVQTVEYSNGNIIVDAPRGGKVYMAGSFNPLHEGHRGMLAAAIEARQGKQGLYEAGAIHWHVVCIAGSHKSGTCAIPSAALWWDAVT